MMAIGCQQYRACNSNHCPVGIATQREELRARFDLAESSERLINFRHGTRHQPVDFARICGRRRLADLGRQDLVSYDDDLATYTFIRHAVAAYEG
jgi:glutamate synthase domain-containing protein 2